MNAGGSGRKITTPLLPCQDLLHLASILGDDVGVVVPARAA